MSEEERKRSDWEAINWAWQIVRDRGDPQPTDEYWDELLRIVSERCKEKNTFYKHLGTAILNEMEERYKCKD